MLFRIIVATCFGSGWRLKKRCMAARNPLMRRLLVKLYGALQYEYGSSVAWDARFASEPCFPHGPMCVFISGGARIGRNAVIFQQVTIGSNTLAGSPGFGAPEIGDNCYIGAGAKVIGKVRIGDNVRIAANAVVYKDVPDNSVVLSGEQRTLVGREGMDNRFYTRRGGWCVFDDGAWVAVSDPELRIALDRAAGNAG